MTSGTFVIRAQYIKDLSLELPNAHNTFLLDEEFTIENGCEIQVVQLDKDMYDVAVVMTVSQKNEKNTLYMIQLDYHAIFSLENYAEDELEKVLLVNCPLFMYPFMRQIIITNIMSAGLIPPEMQPIDFLGLFHSSKKPAAEIAG